MGKKISNNDLVALKAAAMLREGWTLEQGGNHKKLRSPNGKIAVPVPRDPDHRGGLNWLKQIRKMEGQA